MTNDTSRLSVNGTTGPTEPLAGGRHLAWPEPLPESDSPVSTQIHISARSGASSDFRLDVPPETLPDVEAMLAKAYPDHRVIDFTGSGGRVRLWREELRFKWWELRARLYHVLGGHTMIPKEIWDTEQHSITFNGRICWLCPKEDR